MKAADKLELNGFTDVIVGESAIEDGNAITFLHKIKNGAVDKSYGIHVARLAKMPEELLNRADEILNEYETKAKKNKKDDQVQLSISFDEPKEITKDVVKEKLETIDPLHITPLEALNLLFELKDMSAK